MIMCTSRKQLPGQMIWHFSPCFKSCSTTCTIWLASSCVFLHNNHNASKARMKSNSLHIMHSIHSGAYKIMKSNYKVVVYCQRSLFTVILLRKGWGTVKILLKWSESKLQICWFRLVKPWQQHCDFNPYCMVHITPISTQRITLF